MYEMLSFIYQWFLFFSIFRWGYDVESKSCRQYNYGGCLGNNNRYESKEECEAVCVEETGK